MHYSIIKFEGIKNCDTKTTTGGYLWVKFLKDTSLKHIAPNVIGAKPTLYDKDRQYGFPVPSTNRKDAINYFQSNYEILN